MLILTELIKRDRDNYRDLDTRHVAQISQLTKTVESRDAEIARLIHERDEARTDAKSARDETADLNIQVTLLNLEQNVFIL